MTKHGQKRQLKRIAAPPLIPVPRKKGGRFIIKPHPGPHPASRAIPLGIILRDTLRYARTLKEAKRILNEGVIKVDGKVVKDYKYPVGMMDVIELVKTEEFYRIVPYQRRLVLHKIPKDEARYKIARIIGKRYVKNGHIQLNLEDSRNILFKTGNEEERRKILDTYFVGDSLMITIPDQKIIRHYHIEERKYAIITAGRHMGTHGKIQEIHKLFGPRASTVTIVTPANEHVITALEYVLVIGEDRPEISLPTIEEIELIRRR